jgi:hypothetical protein
MCAKRRRMSGVRAKRERWVRREAKGRLKRGRSGGGESEWRRKRMGRERARRWREGAAARTAAAARRTGSGTWSMWGRDRARRAGRCGREGWRNQFGVERAAARCARSAGGEVGRRWEEAMGDVRDRGCGGGGGEAGGMSEVSRARLRTAAAASPLLGSHL